MSRPARLPEKNQGVTSLKIQGFDPERGSPATKPDSTTNLCPDSMDHEFSQWQPSPNQTFTSLCPPEFHPHSSKLQAAPGVVRKTARWNQLEHKAFIDTCELVIAEGHRRGKCFSSKGWQRISDMFNSSTGKDWTTTQMKNYWNKLRTDHKLMFELLRCTEIEYRSGTGRIHTADHWWEAKIKENPKYAKYRNFNCSEIYDTYGRLFGDTGDSTKYALSPTKLSHRGFDLGTDSDREYGGDKLPINAEATDSSGSPVEGRTNSSMNISAHHSGDKRKTKHRKGKAKKKMFGAREVSASLEQMVSVGTDLASIARSYRKGGMTIESCVDELLSSGHVQEGDRLHLFALWFLRDKDNWNSYCAAKTPHLRFKFIEYCFERDNMSINRKD
ncbi:unnamed protein product [Fraxinus pennsylvanica]|uniref:Myb/SANT-like domain-containing protein n=1 Tax=Fraxinus pennsylvanica TaxID=56036 RepID=A0AAD2AA22_9LAMI|nr:unnamed protein product [Fraxinus pennsylvanica]